MINNILLYNSISQCIIQSRFLWDSRSKYVLGELCWSHTNNSTNTNNLIMLLLPFGPPRTRLWLAIGLLNFSSKGWYCSLLSNHFKLNFKSTPNHTRFMRQNLHWKSQVYYLPILYSPSDNGMFWIEDSLLFLNINFKRATHSLWLPSQWASHLVSLITNYGLNIYQFSCQFTDRETMAIPRISINNDLVNRQWVTPCWHT